LANSDRKESTRDRDANSPYIITYSRDAYQKESSWTGDSYRDLYLTDVGNGKSVLIGKKIEGSARLSPSFEYVYWYNAPDTSWFAYDINRKTTREITPTIKHLVFDELNDRPMYPNDYGLAGWLKDDDAVLIYDRYDIWTVDPTGVKSPKNLTNGRSGKTTYRYASLDPDERFIDPNQSLLLHTFDHNDKSSGYTTLQLGSGQMKTVIKEPFAFSRRPQKAKQGNTVTFTKESFSTFPDIVLTKDMFKSSKKVSDANPQQKDYRWGSIELFEWTAYDGQKLKGLLVKPAGFDPSKKYPMIVNFYERSSDGLYTHRYPAPHRSTINYSFYASRGYLIFNPDVFYKTGYPGEGAYNSAVSGTEALIKEGFVDQERIALQGHSWGGYQIAHILTKTDLYKCAESGAPVVNMISAYGGIRWGSGMSRMFQYEHTQSRIGAALWEKPELYIENSPIFNIDKINTPVLILHNDEDSAVPWYQGIEFFVAMRRLGKPAWMLNYNGEPHWPVKLQNRKDFNIRMQQFFDHYLQDAPMPSWMKRGVPAIEKGILQGYELMDQGKN
jgi:dienelactone hydrolase